jgi:hypothetical protein
MVRTVILAAIVLLIALLAALNWSTLATPALISLGITSVNAPLGLVMLGLTLLLAVFFVAYVLYLQSSVLLETRRHTRELQAQRELADKAEASRFTELRAYLEARQQQEGLEASSTRESLLVRIDQLESAIALRIEEAGNSTAAHVGQLEDRLARSTAGVPFEADPLRG